MPDELERIRERLKAEIQEAASRRAADPVDVSTQEWDGFLQRNPVVLADFWAVWCGPCRASEPVVADVARRWAGRVAVAKVNVDREPALSERYRVASIPMFLFFQGGRVAGRLVGVQPPTAFDEVLRELVPQPKT